MRWVQDSHHGDCIVVEHGGNVFRRKLICCIRDKETSLPLYRQSVGSYCISSRCQRTLFIYKIFVEDNMHNATTTGADDGANGFLGLLMPTSFIQESPFPVLEEVWRGEGMGRESCGVVKKGKSPGVKDPLSNQKVTRGQLRWAMQMLLPSGVNASEQYSRITNATFPEFVRKLISLHGGTLTQKLNPDSEFTIIILFFERCTPQILVQYTQRPEGFILRLTIIQPGVQVQYQHLHTERKTAPKTTT